MIQAMATSIKQQSPHYLLVLKILTHVNSILQGEIFCHSSINTRYIQQFGFLPQTIGSNGFRYRKPKKIFRNQFRHYKRSFINQVIHYNRSNLIYLLQKP
ncbi:unnamed protein product [Paramecium octaurelia]|uniref:Uncharacterized protein n=1 Tax=Paramecium octaurelia TaxID=43137 RepID=A0A8S1XVP1_PAROT|nr:unnamed protein product [Paramecium octaurelia]CAD8215102.1 unnamed protein product [Paramecium octaurelia]